MKTRIQTIEDAFLFQLQQLFYTESLIRQGLFTQNIPVASNNLRREIKEYSDSSYSKLLKLERIFNYLMSEPSGRKTLLMQDILRDTAEVLEFTPNPHLRDVLVVNAFKSINATKTSHYKSAYIFSVELELDTPSDLIEQILEWEIASGKVLSRLAIEEFNNLALPLVTCL